MANYKVVHIDLDTGEFVLKSTAVTGGGSPFVIKSGDTMTGFLTLSADPTDNLHAATKQYVDTVTNNMVYTHVQSISASTWIIAHNKNTNKFVAQVYIGSELVQPDGIVAVDLNTIEVLFNTTLTGQVNVILWE